MATRVLTDCYIKIDTVDFSGQGTKAAISIQAAEVDQTSFGDAMDKAAAGRIKWGASFELNADEAITGVLFDKLVARVPVSIEIRASADPISADNPSYTGNAVIVDYSPLDGSVGDNHKVTLAVSGAGALSRTTV